MFSSAKSCLRIFLDKDDAVLVFDKIENPYGFLWNTMILVCEEPLTSHKEKDFELYKGMQEITIIASKSKLEC
jgi:hypothetical protein